MMRKPCVIAVRHSGRVMFFVAWRHPLQRRGEPREPKRPQWSSDRREAYVSWTKHEAEWLAKQLRPFVSDSRVVVMEALAN